MPTVQSFYRGSAPKTLVLGAVLSVLTFVLVPWARHRRRPREAKDASTTGGLTLAPTTCKPFKKARLVNGKAVAPASAPARVKRVIAAANRIRLKKYIYGGGHSLSRKLDKGYDCSGSVSYALRAARFIKYPMPSGSFMRWKAPGAGKWITTYANGGHMYMVVAGLSFDTSNMSSTGGNRWSTTIRSSRGFKVRHPAGF